MKYQVRKLVTLALLILLGFMPRIIATAKDILIPNPYHIAARNIEAYGLQVDVVGLYDVGFPADSPVDLDRHLGVFVYIPQWNSWSKSQKSGLMTLTQREARAMGLYDTVDLIVGWSGPTGFDGIWGCSALWRVSNCDWVNLPGTLPISESYILWPGIGNP